MKEKTLNFIKAEMLHHHPFLCDCRAVQMPRIEFSPAKTTKLISVKIR